ncbi:MAM domain-containing protein [Caerostris extrusa]|uniref:MAM domain-containing protein n=1 Tax=Caerostris extrusa TaxID=172846 RepID=A0AAV4PAW1_CAEEX|nr:MAM domain-containing protein [Caerostris extrusa]
MCGKECGTAMMLSPWIEPRERDVKLIFRYKLYGTSNVYLRLYLKTDDGKQQTLFSKAGNYKLTFPEEWSARVLHYRPHLRTTGTVFELIPADFQRKL